MNKVSKFLYKLFDFIFSIIKIISEKDKKMNKENIFSTLNREDQIKTICRAIINCFETSSIKGKYDSVTLMNGDTGGLTYGKSQTTINSGNLYILLKMYIDNPNSNKNIVLRLLEYMDRIKNKDVLLSTHDNIDFEKLSLILKEAGKDPVMINTQNEFFDNIYLNPSIKICKELKLILPLSLAVVYDSMIHGSFSKVRKMFTQVPPLAGGDEKEWTTAYVYARSEWLSNHSNKLLRITNYRMETFKELIRNNNWDLNLPITAHGIKITEDNIL